MEQLREAVGEIQRSLGRIEGKLDEMHEVQGKHESRIRRIEFRHAKMAGMAAVVAVGAATAWDWVKTKIGM